MKVHCPQCRTAYNIPEDRIPENGIKATCRKCGTGMMIRQESEEVLASKYPTSYPEEKVEIPEAVRESSESVPEQSDEDPFSVIAMSPVYPKGRDTRIFAAAAVILILILAGGYFVLRGAQMPSLKTEWNPMASILRFITGGEVYETCETFIHQNEPLFQSLGGDLRVSLIRQNVKSVKGRKTAAVLVNSQGTKATGQVYFQLRKDGDKWRVLTAAMRIGKGKFQTLYPRGNPGTEGKI